MPTVVTPSDITPPRVQFLDEKGQISRPWFMWLLNMFRQAGETAIAGSVFSQELEALGLTPAAQSVAMTGKTLTSSLTSFATADQQLTDSDTTIAFDSDSPGNFGGLVRSGNSFTGDDYATFLVMFEPHIRQDANNNVTKFWITRNGVAVPNTGISFVAASINDSNVVQFIMSGVVAPGDVLEFHAITSLPNGSSLDYVAAAAPAPSITAVQVIILGFR